MIISKNPGLYELVGDENGTGTMLAALIGQQVTHTYPFLSGEVVWLASTADYAPVVFDLMEWWPDRLYQVALVAAAFEVVRAIDEAGLASLIVLDSLAGLQGSHPQARTIANDVKRGIAGWEPQTLVLVVNQQRTPAPPGGVYWRGQVNSRTLSPLSDQPIISHLVDHVPDVPPSFLVWHSNTPEFRPLLAVEWRMFFPDGIPGYQVFLHDDGDVALAPIGLKEHRQPWLIDRRIQC